MVFEGIGCGGMLSGAEEHATATCSCGMRDIYLNALSPWCCSKKV